MKKVIGFFGVAIIVLAAFFNTNSLNSGNLDTNLADLIQLDTANAEDSDWFSEAASSTACTKWVFSHYEMIPGPNGGITQRAVYIQVGNGTQTICELAWTTATCYNTACGENV